MKILVRILGICIVGLIVSTGLIYLVNTNAIINELNDVSSLAMNQTQSYMKTIVAKRLDGISVLFSDEDYSNLFINNFSTQVLDSTIYTIKTETNAEKGIIYAEIGINAYPLIPTKKLVNIINIEGEGLDDLESLGYTITTKNTKKTIGTKLSDGLKARTINTWDLASTTNVTKYGIVNLIACNTKEDNPVIYYGPSAELRCVKEDGSYSVIDSFVGGINTNKTNFQGDCNESCRYVELVLTENINNTGSFSKVNGIKVDRTSYITYTTTTKKKISGYIVSEHVDITSRYIDKIERLTGQSIWLQNKEYTQVLEEYLRRI